MPAHWYCLHESLFVFMCLHLSSNVFMSLHMFSFTSSCVFICLHVSSCLFICLHVSSYVFICLHEMMCFTSLQFDAGFGPFHKKKLLLESAGFSRHTRTRCGGCTLQLPNDATICHTVLSLFDKASCPVQILCTFHSRSIFSMNVPCTFVTEFKVMHSEVALHRIRRFLELWTGAFHAPSGFSLNKSLSRTNSGDL